MNTYSTLGLRFGLPVALLAIILGLLFAAVGYCIYFRTPGRDISDTCFVLASAGLVIALVTAGITGVSMWPWKYDYHHYQGKVCTVQQTGSRFLGDGKNAATQYYIASCTDGNQYRIDDTRAALLQAGQTVDLSCVKEYQFSGTSGWDCNWVGLVR